MTGEGWLGESLRETRGRRSVSSLTAGQVPGLWEVPGEMWRLTANNLVVVPGATKCMKSKTTTTILLESMFSENYNFIQQSFWLLLPLLLLL